MSFVFQDNLQRSLEIAGAKDLKGYWLNTDGTITPKDSWIGRVFRWILNLFFNKTLKDIWHVFNRAMRDFEEAKNDGGAILEKRRTHLRFAAGFLHSRNAELPKMDLETMIYLRNIPIFLTEKPPELKFAVTPESDPETYSSLDLEEFCLRYEGDKGDSFKKMIHAVKNRDPDVFGVNEKIRAHYYDQMELFLKNILHYLKKDIEISNVREKGILEALACASEVCAPAWLETSRGQYYYLSLSDSGDVKVKILTLIERIKEDLLFEIAEKHERNVEFHIINRIRKEYGKEFGLNEKSSDLDTLGPKEGEYILKSIRSEFLQSYQGTWLAERLRVQINQEIANSYDPSYFLFLKQRLQETLPDGEDAGTYLLVHFTDGNGKLNLNGAIFLLQELNLK